MAKIKNMSKVALATGLLATNVAIGGALDNAFANKSKENVSSQQVETISMDVKDTRCQGVEGDALEECLNSTWADKTPEAAKPKPRVNRNNLIYHTFKKGSGFEDVNRNPILAKQLEKYVANDRNGRIDGMEAVSLAHFLGGCPLDGGIRTTFSFNGSPKMDPKSDVFLKYDCEVPKSNRRVSTKLKTIRSPPRDKPVNAGFVGDGKSDYSLVDLTKAKFDIDADGVVNYLTLVKGDDGSILVKSQEGKNNPEYMTVDAARYIVQQNARDVEGAHRDAWRGYMMTHGNQGTEVVKFMTQTNKYATEISDANHIPSAQTKFDNLEALVTFIDKVANLSKRSDYINEQVISSMNSGQFKVGGENINLEKSLKAYSGTFGEEVPTGLQVLYFTLGSAIYTVINSDFLPGTQASEALVIARGGQDSENLKSLTTAYGKGDLVQGAVNAYKDTKNMYDAQFKASMKRVERLAF